jgi:serine/threonine protein kinase
MNPSVTQVVKEVVRGLAAALRECHEKTRLIHGDIKPGNFLLDKRYNPSKRPTSFKVCVGWFWGDVPYGGIRHRSERRNSPLGGGRNGQLTCLCVPVSCLSASALR